MRAHADVAASGRARVSLEIGVEVQGGWLERIELASLGNDVVLDPGKPPVIWDDAGHKYAGLGRITDDGRVLLEFGDKKHAPRRGAYHLRVVYETPLAEGHAPAQRVLALPAWPLSLNHVELWVNAPAGTRFAPGEEGAIEQRSVQHFGDREALHIVRPQLPRTSVLDAELTLPGTPSQSLAPANTPSEDSRGSAQRTTLATLFALGLLVLKASALRAQRTLRRVREPALTRARTRQALRLDLDRARRARMLRLAAPSSALDASTPLGLCVLLCAACGAAFVAWNTGDSLALQALLAASPLWFFRARAHAPATAADALLALDALLPALATRIGDAAAPRLEVTSHGAAHDAGAPRIALRVRTRPQGLLALRLVVTRDAHGVTGFAWHAIAEQNSPAVACILDALPHARTTPSAPLAHAVGLLAPTQRPAHDVPALLAALAESAQPQPTQTETQASAHAAQAA